MRLLTLLGLLTCVLLNSSAQTDFRAGYIITNKMDTLQGLVDYRSDSRNMKVCSFKETTESFAKEYSPGSIFGYRFKSGKFYISKSIQTKEFNDTVFVEFLLKGLSNLYYYSSPKYSAYFIDSESTKMLEIRSNTIEFEKDGTTFTRRDKRYIGLLGVAFADCPEVRRDIAQVGLTHKSLINITRKYHDYKCNDEACIVYEKKLPVLKIELKPTVGYAYSVMKYNDPLIEDIDFKTSQSPFVGVGMNFIVPRWNEKLTFLVNLAFNKDYFYGTSQKSSFSTYTNSYYHIYKDNLISSFSLKYTYPKGKFRPDIFLGFYGHSILNSRTKLYKETISNDRVLTNEEEHDIFKKFNSGITCGIGVEYVFFKKLRAFSNFTMLHGTNTQNNDIETSYTSYRFSTGIIF